MHDKAHPRLQRSELDRKVALSVETQRGNFVLNEDYNFEKKYPLDLENSLRKPHNFPSVFFAWNEDYIIFVY